jgi:hypothetical protein
MGTCSVFGIMLGFTPAPDRDGSNNGDDGNAADNTASDRTRIRLFRRVR